MSAEPCTGGRAGAQDPEVAAGLTALAERRGGADDGVLARAGRAGELERDRAAGVGDDQVCGRQVGELRWSRRRRPPRSWPNWARVQLILAEQQEAAQGATLAQTAVAPGCPWPRPSRRPVGPPESPPGGRHAAEDGTDAHLCAGCAGWREWRASRLIWPNGPSCETFRAAFT